VYKNKNKFLKIMISNRAQLLTFYSLKVKEKNLKIITAVCDASKVINVCKIIAMPHAVRHLLL
jgi:hypothetical protein